MEVLIILLIITKLTNREMITIFIPFKKALRISAGFLINRNTIHGKATFGDDERWGFVFDLGIIYSGTPDLVINAAVDPTDPNKATFEKHKKKEVDQLQEDLNQFEFYPRSQHRNCLSVLIF